jgi:FtsP/CotA-like multicopper oxidase with cupredoxin domain
VTPEISERRAPDAPETSGGAPTRRLFIDTALAATTAVAVTQAVPFAAAAAGKNPHRPAALAAPAPTPPAGIPAASKKLVRIGEIRSSKRKLRAVITVRNERKLVPTGFDSTNTKVTYAQSAGANGQPVYPMLRYFHGRNPGNSAQQWPPPNPSGVANAAAPAGPGPTLRCELDDFVEITLLNHVRTEDFGGTLDAGETGRSTGCDTVKFIGGNPNLGSGYPNNDRFPDCLHGSSSANIHFHGTHVTPSTTGDNVLVNVRPNPKVTERDVAGPFAEIFAFTEMMRHSPQKWAQLPRKFRVDQERLLKQYDKTAPWKGGRGLPHDEALWPQNERAIEQDVWPQWYVGAYPYSFHIPKYAGEDRDGNPAGVTMGQSPGTHWYHSHKHGSTAINMFNGLSGALIIEDNSPSGYDGKLKSFYAPGGHALEDVVLVFQQLLDLPNLMSTNPTGPSPTLVNGEYAPTITMKPGQTMLWRLINSCARNTVGVNFQQLGGATASIAYKQTAQDGVQLDFTNYSAAGNASPQILMAAANRVDLLVQAPSTPGVFGFGTIGPDANAQPLMYVNVAGTAISPAMGFPQTKDQFPTQPHFLKDLDPASIRLHRTIEYGWRRDPRGRNLPDKSVYGGRQPEFTINGRQFQDSTIDEVMLLENVEEWLLINSTTKIAHPFHIHINPFQIIEVFDPSVYASLGVATPAPPPPTPFPTPALFNTKPAALTGPFVWWDTFAIPAGVFLPAGTVDPTTGKPPIDPRTGQPVVLPGILPGYFRMRTRFADFTGLYVQHCHILAHEDRGMMQLLEVVSNKTILKHH